MYTFYLTSKSKENIEETHDLKTFVGFYNCRYFLTKEGEANDPVLYSTARSRRGVTQNSYLVEQQIDGILNNGIRSEKDVMKILAWKIGKIKHKKSQIDLAKGKNIAYHSDWEKAEECDVKRYGKEWKEIKPFAKYIADNICHLEKLAANDRPIEVLSELRQAQDCLKLKWIGPVYLLTLLYFISKGNYPIYDQFAHYALKAIEEQKSFTEQQYTTDDINCEVDQTADLERFFSTYKEKYLKRLQDIFQDEYKNRDVDRALWVYGHLYKDRKTKTDKTTSNK